MNLTTQQLATLQTDINGQASLANARITHDAEAVVAFYNALAVPAWQVWKDTLSIMETGQAFNGGELAGLTTGNQQRLQTIAVYFASGLNPSLPDVRQMFTDIFSGAGGTTTRANLNVVWQRAASVAEKLFSTGTGTTVSPATMSPTAQDALTVSEVFAAMGW